MPGAADRGHTIAALYDIHGNLPALEAVLADVRDAAVDGIVVGGDSGTDAQWLLIGGELEPRSTAYDLADAERRIRATGYPRTDEFIQVALR